MGDNGLSGEVLAQGLVSTSQHHHGQRQREQLELEAGCSHTVPRQSCPDPWLRQPQQQQPGMPAGASPCHGQQPRATILSRCAGLSCAPLVMAAQLLRQPAQAADRSYHGL